MKKGCISFLVFEVKYYIDNIYLYEKNFRLKYLMNGIMIKILL